MRVHTEEKNRINEFKTGFSLLIWMQSISIKDIRLSGEQQQSRQKIWTFSMQNIKKQKKCWTTEETKQSKAMRKKNKWRQKTHRQKLKFGKFE